MKLDKRKQKGKTYFIGVDPGNDGAIAIIDSYGNVYRLCDYPGDEVLTARLVNEFADVHFDCVAAVEQVSAFKMGRTGAFTFGGNYSAWKMCFVMAGIPFRLVRPQVWQKGVIGAKDKKKLGKQAGLAVARGMFPDTELHLKKHHGRADALLLADWLRRQYLTESN